MGKEIVADNEATRNESDSRCQETGTNNQVQMMLRLQQENETIAADSVPLGINQIILRIQNDMPPGEHGVEKNDSVDIYLTKQCQVNGDDETPRQFAEL